MSDESLARKHIQTICLIMNYYIKDGNKNL